MIEPARRDDQRRLSPRRGWLAVIAVAIGIFVLITSELLPVGLLPAVGAELSVSDGTAGLMLTAPGLVAAVTAPIVAVYAGGIDRRVLLAALLASVAVANLVSALASHFAVLVAARLLIGVGVGGFWAIAGGLALRLVPHRQLGPATAVIFGGVSAGAVLGVPTATLIGDLSGWRTAFTAVGLLGALALAGLICLLPPLPATDRLRFPQLLALLRNPGGVRLGVAATFALVGGHFAAYTFIRPALTEVSNVDGRHIGPLLLVYGLAGLAGNAIAGTLAHRDVRRTLLLISGALATALLLFATVGDAPLRAIGLLVCWGLAFGGVSVALQTWMLRAAPHAAEAATSLYVAAFNLAIALGAVLGGLAVNQLAATGGLWLGGALTLIAVAIFARAARPHDHR